MYKRKVNQIILLLSKVGNLCAKLQCCVKPAKVTHLTGFCRVGPNIFMTCNKNPMYYEFHGQLVPKRKGLVLHGLKYFN